MSNYHDVSGDHPTLEEYASGEWVTYAQQLLQQAGYEPQDHKIDGKFGPMTKEAVRDFQGAHGLTVDGVIGPQTWAALEGRGGGAGSTGQLSFDKAPQVESSGWLVWSVKNVGSATVTAYSSAGNYEMYDSSNTTIPGGDTQLAADLAPGDASGDIGVDLSYYTPNDGEYQVSVQVSNEIHYVNYKMVGGRAQPN